MLKFMALTILLFRLPTSTMYSVSQTLKLTTVAYMLFESKKISLGTMAFKYSEHFSKTYCMRHWFDIEAAGLFTFRTNEMAGFPRSMVDQEQSSFCLGRSTLCNNVSSQIQLASTPKHDRHS